MGNDLFTVTDEDGVPVAGVPADRSVLHINWKWVESTFVDVFRRPPEAAVSAAEAFAVVIYLAKHGMVDDL